jgi:hypothetical protein
MDRRTGDLKKPLSPGRVITPGIVVAVAATVAATLCLRGKNGTKGEHTNKSYNQVSKCWFHGLRFNEQIGNTCFINKSHAWFSKRNHKSGEGSGKLIIIARNEAICVKNTLGAIFRERSVTFASLLCKPQIACTTAKAKAARGRSSQ